jgi:GNAT superfamily N-acetyltransferase
VRGIAAKDHPLAVIEAWAPMPATEDAIERVRANPEKEYRLIAEMEGRVIGIGAAVFEKFELRACYVAPDAGRRGVGSALEHAVFGLNRGWGFPNRGDFDSTCWLGGGQQECRIRIRKTCGIE